MPKCKFYICLFFLMHLTGCGQEISNSQRLENWQLVKKAVRIATKPSNQQNSHLKRIYDDLSEEKREENLILLSKIKKLETQSRNEVTRTTKLLRKKHLESKDEIFLIGIEYITAVHALDSILPRLYLKAESDINGELTYEDKEILMAIDKILAANEKYQRTMNDYRSKYNLDVPEISIPHKSKSR